MGFIITCKREVFEWWRWVSKVSKPRPFNPRKIKNIFQGTKHESFEFTFRKWKKFYAVYDSKTGFSSFHFGPTSLPSPGVIRVELGSVLFLVTFSLSGGGRFEIWSRSMSCVCWQSTWKRPSSRCNASHELAPFASWKTHPYFNQIFIPALCFAARMI